MFRVRRGGHRSCLQTAKGFIGPIGISMGSRTANSPAYSTRKASLRPAWTLDLTRFQNSSGFSKQMYQNNPKQLVGLADSIPLVSPIGEAKGLKDSAPEVSLGPWEGGCWVTGPHECCESIPYQRVADRTPKNI